MHVNTTAAVFLKNQNLHQVMKYLLLPFAALELQKIDVVFIVPFDVEHLAVRAPNVETILQVKKPETFISNFLNSRKLLEWGVERNVKLVITPYLYQAKFIAAEMTIHLDLIKRSIPDSDGCIYTLNFSTVHTSPLIEVVLNGRKATVCN